MCEGAALARELAGRAGPLREGNLWRQLLEEESGRDGGNGGDGGRRGGGGREGGGCCGDGGGVGAGRRSYCGNRWFTHVYDRFPARCIADGVMPQAPVSLVITNPTTTTSIAAGTTTTTTTIITRPINQPLCSIDAMLWPHCSTQADGTRALDGTRSATFAAWRFRR